MTTKMAKKVITNLFLSYYELFGISIVGYANFLCVRGYKHYLLSYKVKIIKAI